MITKLSLKNWRSHENSEFEFASGTNILIGRMGSGKTSVLDGICFGLFGTFPALQRRRVRLGELVRNSEASAEVTLEFSKDGESYSVSRKIENGATEGHLRKSGKLLEGPQSQSVTDYIEQLLRVDYELFTRAIYSEQNQIDYFLAIPRGERKKQIDELLGISKFEKVRANLSSVLNKAKMIKEDKGIVLKALNIEGLSKDAEALEREIEFLKSQHASAKKELENIEKERAEVEKQVAELDKKEAIFRGMRDRRTGLLSSLKNIPEIMDVDKSKLDALKKEIEKTKWEISENRKRVEVLINEEGKASEKVGEEIAKKKEAERELEKKHQLEKNLREILSGKKISELESDLSELSKFIESIGEKLHASKAEKEQVEKSLSGLRGADSKCPVCDSPLDEEKRGELEKERGERIRGLAQLINDHEKTFMDSKKKKQEAEQKLGQAKLAEASLCEMREFDLSSLVVRLSKVRESLFDLKKGREEEEKKLIMLEKSEREKSDKLSELIRALENIERKAKLDKELKIVEVELEKIKFDENVFSAVRRVLEERKLSEAEWFGKCERYESDMKRVGQMLKMQKETLERSSKQLEEIGKYAQVIDSMKIFQNAVIDTQQALRAELIDAINGAMSEIWQTVYPYGDYKGIRLRVDDNDYSLELLSGETWVSADGIVSGGERSSACLALRIAFAMVLVPNLNWLILDEPTHNLDEAGVNSLTKALSEDIPKIVEQVFVITHDEKLRDAASANLYLLDRNKEARESTKIERIS